MMVDNQMTPLSYSAIAHLSHFIPYYLIIGNPRWGAQSPEEWGLLLAYETPFFYKYGTKLIFHVPPCFEWVHSAERLPLIIRF